MVKLPDYYVESEEEVPSNKDDIGELDVKEGNKPHVHIEKFKELSNEEEKIYVRILKDVGDYNSVKEVESPSLEDAFKVANSFSKEYDIPVLLDNVKY